MSGGQQGKIREYHRKYREANHEKLLEKQKVRYREVNRENTESIERDIENPTGRNTVSIERDIEKQTESL